MSDSNYKLTVPDPIVDASIEMVVKMYRREIVAAGVLFAVSVVLCICVLIASVLTLNNLHKAIRGKYF